MRFIRKQPRGHYNIYEGPRGCNPDTQGVKLAEYMCVICAMKHASSGEAQPKCNGLTGKKHKAVK